jgi:hypothetical protein
MRSFLGYDAAIRLIVVPKSYSTMRPTVSKTLRIVVRVGSLSACLGISRACRLRWPLASARRPVAGTCAVPGYSAAPGMVPGDPVRAVPLAAGTVTVANTAVTATSRIFLTAQSLGTVTNPAGARRDRPDRRDVIHDHQCLNHRYLSDRLRTLRTVLGQAVLTAPGG